MFLIPFCSVVSVDCLLLCYQIKSNLLNFYLLGALDVIFCCCSCNLTVKLPINYSCSKIYVMKGIIYVLNVLQNYHDDECLAVLLFLRWNTWCYWNLSYDNYTQSIITLIRLIADDVSSRIARWQDCFLIYSDHVNLVILPQYDGNGIGIYVCNEDRSWASMKFTAPRVIMYKRLYRVVQKVIKRYLR